MNENENVKASPQLEDNEESIEPRIRPIDQLLRYALGDMSESSDIGTSDQQLPVATTTLAMDLAELLPERFQVEGVLGQGTFGIVYRAMDTRLQRSVAIKVLRPEWALHASTKNRFLRESRAACRLNHSAIVRVLEADENDSIAWQVCDLVHGTSLAPILRQGPLSAIASVQLTHRIAMAVACAHDHGIAHRDIKPDNVLIDCESRESIQESSAYLTDFGLAKFLEEQMEESQHGVIVGTMQYMAPEQFESGSDIDYRRCDVYALGMLLYECLCGKNPFAGASTLSQRIAKSREPVPSIRRVSPRIDRDLERICGKALERDLQLRYQSADCFASDLDSYLHGLPVSVRRQSFVERVMRLARANPTLSVMLAFIILCLAGFALFLQRSNDVISNQQNQLQSMNSQLEERIEVANQLTATSNELRRVSDLDRERFSELAWRSEMREAYRCWESGDLAGAKRGLAAMRQSHGEKASRLEWKLLACQLDEVYREGKLEDSSIEQVSEIPDNGGLAYVAADGHFGVVNTSTLETEHIYMAKERGLNALAVMSESKVLFGGRTYWNMFQSRVSEYDWSQKRLESCKLFFPTTIDSIVTSQSGRYVFAGSRNEDLVLLDRETGKRASFPSRMKNDCLSVLEAQKQFFYIKNSNTLGVVRYLPWYEQSEVSLVGDTFLRRLAAVPDRSLLIMTITNSDSLLVIDTVSWECVAQLRSVMAGASIDCLVVSNDGKFVVAGSGSGNLCIWDLSKESWWQNRSNIAIDSAPLPSRAVVTGLDQEMPSVQAASYVVSDESISSLCIAGGKVCCGTANGKLAVMSLNEFGFKSTSVADDVENESNSVYYDFACKTIWPIDSPCAILGDKKGRILRATPLEDGMLSEPFSSWKNSMFNAGQVSAAELRNGKVVGEVHRRESLNARYETDHDGSQIAWLDSKGQIALLSDTGIRFLDFPFSKPKGVIGVSPDGTMAVVSAENYVLYLVSLTSSPRILRTFKLEGHGLAVDWHEQENRIVIVGDVEAVYEYDFGEDKLRKLCKTSHNSIAVRYSRDRSIVYSGHSNGKIKATNLDTSEVRTMALHQNEIVSLCFDRDERLGFSVDKTDGIAIWEVSTGELIGFLVSPKRDRLRKLSVNQAIHLAEDETSLECILRGKTGPQWRKWDLTATPNFSRRSYEAR
jgi:serine/threonine protein kinase/WD40 repeat protein